MQKHLKRQSFLGANSGAVIKGSHAAIVGLCGGGSHIAQQLAHIGVGEFSLFDHDHGDIPNRNRMVGLTPKDAKEKRLKTDITYDLIKNINPQAKINLFPQRWQENHTQMQKCTAIFGCVDSFIERDQLEKYARRYMLPYIDIGMDVLGTNKKHFIVGQIILSLPDMPCMRCMGFLTDNLIAKEAKRYGAAGGKPQVIWPNGVLASTAVGIFMSLITPWHQGILPPLYTEYDGNRCLTFPSNKLEIIKDKVCLHFAERNAVGDIVW